MILYVKLQIQLQILCSNTLVLNSVAMPHDDINVKLQI